jgi:hypothetical protein
VQEDERHVLADHRGRLEQALVLGRQTVDARRQHGLHRDRHLRARKGARQPVAAALARQDAALDQATNALLDEEGVALGASDQHALERLQFVRVAQQCR